MSMNILKKNTQWP